MDHSSDPISELPSTFTSISSIVRFADIIQPLTNFDFTLTTLFSFTSSPSPYYHVVVVVVMQGSIIIVVSIIGTRPVDTRPIVVDTSISITITITAVADASILITNISILVVGRR